MKVPRPFGDTGCYIRMTSGLRTGVLFAENFGMVCKFSPSRIYNSRQFAGRVARVHIVALSQSVGKSPFREHIVSYLAHIGQRLSLAHCKDVLRVSASSSEHAPIAGKSHQHANATTEPR